MKIEMTEGCRYFTYTVDGKDFADLSLEVQKDILHKLLDKISNPIELRSLFRDMIPYCDCECYSEGPCECCGDFIDTYKLEI